MATSLNDIIIMTINIIAAAQEECALHTVQALQMCKCALHTVQTLQTPTCRTWNLTLTRDPSTTTNNNDSYLFLQEHLPRKDTLVRQLGPLCLIRI